MIAALLDRFLGASPVQPDGPQGRQWLLDELAKPVYVAARPSWWDQLVNGFWEWLNTLEPPALDDGGLWLLVAGIVVAAGLIVAAFLIFGRPRINRRSIARDGLFGEDDRRSAAEMRAAGASAAARGEWTTAIEEEFRAIARELADRTVVTLTPGTTAHGLAEQATLALAGESDDLARAARNFDGVRYLGEPGGESEYRELTALGSRVASATPRFAEATQ